MMALKILLIDNQPDSEVLYKEALSRKGYKIEIVQNLKRTLNALQEAAAEEKPFHLIVVRDSATLEGRQIIQGLAEYLGVLHVLWSTENKDLPFLLALAEKNVRLVPSLLTSDVLLEQVGRLAKLIEVELDRQELQLSRAQVSPFLQETVLALTLENNAKLIPLIIKYILGTLEFHGLSEENSFRLKLGLSETLINAIAHGNLEMSSSELKGEQSNFKQWNFELQKRAADTHYQGRRVRVRIQYLPVRQVMIQVEDDGSGFDHQKVLQKKPSGEDSFNLFGRGLTMVQSTCEKMEFNAKGNGVTLTYHLTPRDAQNA